MSEEKKITQEELDAMFASAKEEWDTQLNLFGGSEAMFIAQNPDNWPIQFLAEYQYAKEAAEAQGLVMPVLVEGIEINLTDRADDGLYVDIRDKEEDIDTSSIDYGDMVKQLAKPGEQILNELTESDCHLLHMALGVAGEAGEAVDIIKKAVFYRKQVDVEHVIEELGDLEFYMEGLRQGLGVTREECLDANKYKLGKRYKGHQYSDQQAQDRADKK